MHPLEKEYRFRVEFYDYPTAGRPPSPIRALELSITGFEAELYGEMYSQDYVLCLSSHLESYSFSTAPGGYDNKALMLARARSVSPRPPPYYQYHTESVCKALGEAIVSCLLRKLGVEKIYRLPGSGSVWKPLNADFLIDVEGSMLKEIFETISSPALVETRGYAVPRESWLKTIAKMRNQVYVLKTIYHTPLDSLTAVVYTGETVSSPRKVIIAYTH